MEMEFLHVLQGMRTEGLDRFFTHFTALGNAGAMWIVIAVALLFTKRYRMLGVQMALALIIGALIGNVFLKNLVARPRPCWIDNSVILLIENPTDFSFPSGHTLASFSSATVLFLNEKKWGVLALVTAGLMGFSRLYLFVHYPSDVLVGALLGIAIGIVVKRVATGVVSRSR